MGVNTGDKDNNAGNPTGTANFGDSFNRSSGSQTNAPGQGSSQGNAGRSYSSDRPTGVSRLMNLRTGGSRRRPAADLEAMRAAFEEQLKNFRENSTNVPGAEATKVIMIDRQRLQKKVDLLVGVLPVMKEGVIHAAIHTLLVADPSDNYDPIRLNLANRNLQYTTVVGDVYTEDLWASIVTHVGEMSGQRIMPYDAGHQTIPANVDIKDQDLIHTLAFFVSEALTRTTLNSIEQVAADVVSIADLDRNAVVSASITYQTTNARTAAQQPLRADLITSLRYSTGSRSNESQLEKVFDQDASIPLGSATAYVDLSYAEPEVAQPGYTQSTHYYWAHLILTKLDTDQDFITPELSMLSLISSTLMTREHNWAKTWSQSVRGLRPGYHDIGSIGYELPSPDGKPNGVAIDTGSVSFDDVALAKLVTQTIRPNVIVEIDVEESGELSWLNSTMIDVAAGSQQAAQSFIMTLDNLTNGHFSELWDPRWALIIDSGNRIALGHYDDDGERRDIRDLDYLAVETRYGAEDPDMVVMWQRTFDKEGADPEVRLAEREDMQRKILGPTMVITGYARRLQLTPELLDIALEAAGKAGLKIRPNEIQTNFGAASTRGRSDLSSLAYGGAGGRNVFAYGTGGGTNRTSSRTYTGRDGGWRR